MNQPCHCTQRNTPFFNMHTFWDRDVAPARPDERAGPTILAATLTVTIAALLSTIGRGYVRVCMIKNMGWDVSLPHKIDSGSL